MFSFYSVKVISSIRVLLSRAREMKIVKLSKKLETYFASAFFLNVIASTSHENVMGRRDP